MEPQVNQQNLMGRSLEGEDKEGDIDVQIFEDQVAQSTRLEQGEQIGRTSVLQADWL